MADTTTAYLADLTRAVRDLPREVSDGILSEVREELSGLSESAAIERMADLGDPEFIAASARAELPATGITRATDPTWYSVLTAFLVGFGGAVVPFAGWVVGLVLLWKSRLWTRKDKWIGTLLFPSSAVAIVSIMASAGFGFQTDSGGFSPLATGTFVAFVVAPLITTPYLLIQARRLRARTVVD